MQASKTHFEQIPVEAVKKIAKVLPENNATENDSENVQTSNENGSPQEGWRGLAQRAQQEQDPTKMVGLVQQLIATFDEDHQRKHYRLSSRAIPRCQGKSEERP